MSELKDLGKTWSISELPVRAEFIDTARNLGDLGQNHIDTIRERCQQKHVSEPYDFCLHDQLKKNWREKQSSNPSDTVLNQNGIQALENSNVQQLAPNVTDNIGRNTMSTNMKSIYSSFAPNTYMASTGVEYPNSFSHSIVGELETESQESLSNDAPAHSFLRKELLAALSQDVETIFSERTATPDTDSLSMATTTSFDAEQMEDDLTERRNYVPKAKGRRTKKWLDDDDKEPLSYELKIAVRILGEFMVESNKSITWPFMNKVDPDRDGVPDYYDQIKNPVWFTMMKEKFVNREYSGIDEFISDFRIMLQNCYRYNGPDHQISKKAQRLETMLEQKLSLLSRDLREKIETNSVAGSGAGKGYSGARRRRQTVPHDSTMLLNQLRQEKANREREARRLQLEERRQLQEEQSKLVEQWEYTISNEVEKRRLRAMTELPQIGLLLFLCQGPLNVGEVAQYELERSFFMPKQSSTMQRIMTTLLSTPYQRARLHKTPYMPYSVWEEKLRARTEQWYKTLKDSGLDINKTAEKLGIEEKFFKIMGLKNPLRKMKYHELSLYQRVWLVKALGEWCVDQHESLREAIEAQPSVEQKEYILGEDAKGNTYLHFPQFCGADLRVYRQATCELPELIVEPPSPVRKSRKGRQKLSTRYAAARRKLLNERAKAEAAELKAARDEEKREAANRDNHAESETKSNASDSGISHSDSDSQEENTELKSRHSQRAMRKKLTRKKRAKIEKETTGNVSDSSAVNENAITPGRVTRSAWKKSVEDVTPDSGKKKCDNTKNSTKTKSKQRATQSPSPSSSDSENDKDFISSVKTPENSSVDSKTENSKLCPDDPKRERNINQDPDDECHDMNKGKNENTGDDFKDVDSDNASCASDNDQTHNSIPLINSKPQSPLENVKDDERSSSTERDVLPNCDSKCDSSEQQSNTESRREKSNEESYNSPSKTILSNSSQENVNSNDIDNITSIPEKQNTEEPTETNKTSPKHESDAIDNCEEQTNLGKQDQNSKSTDMNTDVGNEPTNSMHETDALPSLSKASEQSTEDPQSEREKEIAEFMMSMSRSGCDNEASVDNNTLKPADIKEEVKEECPDTKTCLESTDIKDEIMDASEIKVEKEEEKAEESEAESELDEPEIKEPEYDDFELMCETVEELRELTEKFEPKETVKKKKGGSRGRGDAEVDLHARLAFLLKELEPWEAKLIQANRRMRAKMKREQETYVEEPIKTSEAWESESSTSEADSDADTTTTGDYDHSNDAPALRPRRKKPATPTPSENSQDIYMDQSEEYGYSSKGRMRKRRIIPNNAEDQCAPKKIKPNRAPKKLSTDPALSPPPMDTNTLKSSTSTTPSQMQHLIFQQPDGRNFTINQNQTLLLRAPSSTPGGSPQLIQIPGSMAIKNPNVITQLLSSGKLGPGTTAMLVENKQETSSVTKALKEQLARKQLQAQTPPQQRNTNLQSTSVPPSMHSNPATTYPAFQFKNTQQNSTASLAHEKQISNQSASMQLAAARVTSPQNIAPNAVVSASPTHQEILQSKVPPQKHSPRILLSPTKSGAPAKTVPLSQLPPHLLSQLPPNVLAQLVKQQASLSVKQDTAQLAKIPRPSPVPAAQLHRQVSPGGGVLVKTTIAGSGNNHGLVNVTPLSSRSSPLKNPVLATGIPPHKPKYSSNVTVKELLERQSAGQTSQSQEKGQGEEKHLITLATSPKKHLNIGNRGGNLSELQNVVGRADIQVKTIAPKATPGLARQDTQEAAEALIRLEASPVGNKETSVHQGKDVTPKLESLQQGNITPINPSSQPIADIRTPPMESVSGQIATASPNEGLQNGEPSSLGMKVVPAASGAVHKVAVLGKGLAKSVAVVNAAKLQELIARKEAIDEAVKQVITEAPTTLPTVQIKVNSPFALSGRQTVRPCTAATMALKHPIPAIPPIPSAKRCGNPGGANTSVSGSGTSQLPSSAIFGSEMQLNSSMNQLALPASVSMTTPNPFPAVSTAPTALVSVKTTPLIHPTEASTSIPSSPPKIASTKPQTVQVIGKDKNATYNLAQQGTSPQLVPSTQKTQTTSIVLPPGASMPTVQGSPKSINLRTLRERGMVLVRTASGQLQLMQTKSPTGGSPRQVAVTQTETVRESNTTARPASGTQNSTVGNATQIQTKDSVDQGNLVGLKHVHSEMTNTGVGSIRSPAVLQNTPKAVVNQAVSSSASPSQNPRAVLAANQLRPAQQTALQQQQTQSVNQLQQQMAILPGAVNQLQQPRLMLVNVNGQLMAQAVPQLNAGAMQAQFAPALGGGIQLVGANTNILQAGLQLAQPVSSLMQPGLQIATPTSSVTAPASLANIQLNQAIRPVMLQAGLQQAPVAMMPGANIQGTQLVMQGAANIQAPLLLQGAAAGGVQGPLMVQGAGGVVGLVAANSSNVTPSSQVMLNLNSVFQQQKTQ